MFRYKYNPFKHPRAFRSSVLSFNEEVEKKGEKNRTDREKRHNFVTRRIIRIRRHCFFGELSDNMLSEFQPIWSRGCRLSKCTNNSPIFLLSRDRKARIRRHPSVMRSSHQRRNGRGISFLYNNESVTVNMEQVHIFGGGAR